MVAEIDERVNAFITRPRPKANGPICESTPLNPSPACQPWLPDLNLTLPWIDGSYTTLRGMTGPRRMDSARSGSIVSPALLSQIRGSGQTGRDGMTRTWICAGRDANNRRC